MKNSNNFLISLLVELGVLYFHQTELIIVIINIFEKYFLITNILKYFFIIFFIFKINISKSSKKIFKKLISYFFR
jgi:hypothetical protein